MAKIKYTKNELKKQKDNLKGTPRYLPSLERKVNDEYPIMHWKMLVLNIK